MNSEHCLALEKFVEKAYLDYSMYVLRERALPHLSDGLKPVQRRIIYAMSELGLSSQSKFKKSARTIGDVLGKFHPHGDAACYEAMVLMAQSFAMRYPLIDGQGNFGSIDDPKSFAAMRYTEARLSSYAQQLLDELPANTTDWQSNFDATLLEPKLLPAKLPNLLLNGTSGIAVGMATDLPPHHLGEVLEACLLLLKKPKASLDEVMQHIKGPDFPTGGVIISSEDELRQAYETGIGNLRLQAQYRVEKGALVIENLPYQVSASKLLEQIADQIEKKKAPWITHLRDESDHEQSVRIVIEFKSKKISGDDLMQHLFALTDLEKSIRFNCNVIDLDGKPKTMPLLNLLNQWLSFRITTTQRRLEHRLDQISDRLHILEGLLIAYLDLDEVIRIIRYEDKPKVLLAQTFNLSDLQIEAILNTRLRNLAQLEQMKIEEEQAKLQQELEGIEKILQTEASLKKQVGLELKQNAKAFIDERRSLIEPKSSSQALNLQALAPAENVSVILSQHGWVRLAKGYDIDANELKYKGSDSYLMHTQGKSNQLACFLDNVGKSYALDSTQFLSARTLGEPLTKYLEITSGAKFIAVFQQDNEDKVCLASQDGYGFITTFSQLKSKNRLGKQVLNLKSSPPVTPVVLSNSHNSLAILTQQSRLLILSLDEIPTLNQGRGNQLIKLDKIDKIQTMLSFNRQEEHIHLQSPQGRLYQVVDDLSFIGKRASKGKFLPSPLRNFGVLAFKKRTSQTSHFHPLV